MFEAKGIDPSQCEGDSSFHNATAAGRGYAVAGGVSSAIEACLHEYYPEVEVHIELRKVWMSVRRSLCRQRPES